ncbi:Cell division topological determinant MinJ [Listeria weihenstephanensis FSL R9-0317]|uniref:Membrane protein n=1 Tax=Listeria weihenstephanensis TaxID=1006155 RepID=A0A1S7FRN6_9LIST|nr:membrane protein [Listeria weihenstephanensis]AQY50052.1 membrane protein [Listeria weihenstephanensis]EUJ40414.1 Cell division topological determinant MinJ [Listeria weihenstephanensis FSL R9-0317]
MDIMLEILKGIGSLFLQPAFYVSILIVIIAGFSRIKAERKSFHVGIYSPWQELKGFFGLGIIFGLVISVVMFFIGFTLTIGWIAIFNVVLIVLLLIGLFRMTSTAYTIGIASLVYYAAYYFDWQLAPFEDKMLPISNLYIDNFMIAIVFVLALLLAVEAFLIQFSGANNASPMLRKSGRGKLIGAFQLRRLWLLPLVCFIPGHGFAAIFDWWPIFQIGNQTFSLMILPVVIGFQQQVQTQLPEQATHKIAVKVTSLAIMIALIGVGSIVMPVLSLVAFVVAIVGRFWISYRHRSDEKRASFKFTPQPEGIMILGSRENTPGSRMEISAGEMILEANGKPVTNREELYEALNENRAYCKLKVRDNNGEPRIVQTAIHEEDSFELGLFMVEAK